MKQKKNQKQKMHTVRQTICRLPAWPMIAATALLAMGPHAALAQTTYNYTGGGAGTVALPVTGTMNPANSWYLNGSVATTKPPSSAANPVNLSFGGSGSTGYTATQNAYSATPFYVNQLILSSTASVTETINGSSNTISFAGSAGNTGIVQNGSGAFIINSILGGTNGMTFGGSGTGIVSLTRNNTYTGPTTISTGTLVVNGSLASGSTVGVSSGATLTGTGTAAGTVTIASGATLNSGGVGAVGTLTTGADTFTSGSNFVFDFGGNTVDELVSTGLVSGLSGANFSFNSLGGTLTNASYTLVSAASSFSDTNLPSSVSNTPTGYQLQYSGNNLNLVQVAAAPEPSQWISLGLGMLFLGGMALKARRRGSETAA